MTPLYILYWDFKKILFTLHPYLLAKVLQNGVKFIEKLTPGFKNHTMHLDNFKQSVGSPKSLNLMRYFFLYIPSARTLYTEDLSNITFN